MFIILTLTVYFKVYINKNEHVDYTLKILHKASFKLIYSFITTLLRFNTLYSKKNC